MRFTGYDFYTKSDIANSVSRALIYSYAKNVDTPIAFRHYKYKRVGDIGFGHIDGRANCCIFVYMSGEFGYITDKSIYNLSYGDVFVARESETFFFKCNTITNLDFYQIDIPCCFFDMVPNSDFFKKIFYQRPKGQKNVISLTPDKKRSLIDRLKKIEYIIARNPVSVDMLTYSYILQIIDILYHSFGRNDQDSLDHSAPPCVISAVNYIKQNYLYITNIDEISSHTGTSTSYLCRTFKKTLNCTVNGYIQQLRISHAKYLLDNGSDVTDACFNSGFNNYSYFIKVFRESVGLTPYKYSKTQSLDTSNDIQKILDEE